MSSKLQDIRQAVAAYQAYAAKDEQEGYNYWLSRNSEEYAAKFANALTDLLAIAAAAGEVVDEGELTRRTNDVRNLACWANLTEALAKLEGE